MRVEKAEPEFAPVALVLTTPEELKIFRRIVWYTTTIPELVANDFGTEICSSADEAEIRVKNFIEGVRQEFKEAGVLLYDDD